MRVYASGYASLKTTHVGHLQFGQVLGSPQPLQCRQQRRLATRAREANQRPCLQGKVLRWPALSTFASQGGYRHIILLLRFCFPAKCHIVYSIRAHASTKSLIVISGKKDIAPPGGAYVADTRSPLGVST